MCFVGLGFRFWVHNYQSRDTGRSAGSLVNERDGVYFPGLLREFSAHGRHWMETWAGGPYGFRLQEVAMFSVHVSRRLR